MTVFGEGDMGGDGNDTIDGGFDDAHGWLEDQVVTLFMVVWATTS